MNRIDRHILELLQTNGKISNQELADQVSLSPSPCLRRVKQLEAAGFIERTVTLLNPEKIGLTLTVMVSVQLTSHEPPVIASFEKIVKQLPEVIQCYMVAGQTHEYLLKVVAPSLNEYQDWLLKRLTQIDSVKNVNSSFVMRNVVDSGPLPLEYAD
jgi:Lrp/AsnC family leucine-responsive transcriptional regulator